MLCQISTHALSVLHFSGATGVVSQAIRLHQPRALLGSTSSEGTPHYFEERGALGGKQVSVGLKAPSQGALGCGVWQVSGGGGPVAVVAEPELRLLRQSGVGTPRGGAWGGACFPPVLPMQSLLDGASLAAQNATGDWRLPHTGE